MEYRRFNSRGDRTVLTNNKNKMNMNLNFRLLCFAFFVLHSKSVLCCFAFIYLWPFRPIVYFLLLTNVKNKTNKIKIKTNHKKINLFLLCFAFSQHCVVLPCCFVLFNYLFLLDLFRQVVYFLLWSFRKLHRMR